MDGGSYLRHDKLTDGSESLVESEMANEIPEDFHEGQRGRECEVHMKEDPAIAKTR